MAVRRPLVIASGVTRELPTDDLLTAAALLEAFRAPIYAGDIDSAPVGWVSIDGSTAHVPAAGVGAMMETFINEDDSARGQLAFLIDNRIGLRFKLSGSWSPWVLFLSGSEVIDSIADADTAHAPSRNAVFDALAGKQAADGTLTGLAAVTTAADSLIYATASDTFTTTTLTSTARTLLDDTTVSDMRTTLGAAGLTPRVVTPSITTSYTINADITDLYVINGQNAAFTVNAPSGTAAEGQKLSVRVKDNGTARVPTWNSIFIGSGVASLLATTVINKTHKIDLAYDAVATKWVCVACDLVGY